MAICLEAPNLLDDRRTQKEDAFTNALDRRIVGERGSQEAGKCGLCARKPGGGLEEATDRARRESRHG
jgi:hypothetical protein